MVRDERIWFAPDGTGQRTVDTAAAGAVQVEYRDDVTVDDLWTDVPRFGDWADLARFER